MFSLSSYTKIVYSLMSCHIDISQFEKCPLPICPIIIKIETFPQGKDEKHVVPLSYAYSRGLLSSLSSFNEERIGNINVPNIEHHHQPLIKNVVNAIMMNVTCIPHPSLQFTIMQCLNTISIKVTMIHESQLYNSIYSITILIYESIEEWADKYPTMIST